ncbi:uncharacterized protein LOC100679373 isoform X1 [Nasonia vitripennis]|uniref:Uncharacterized protein n=1 Tax=Nasonia vitripennis TaxID=7425 RepID=A0A7M7IR80_NASVI|nr:uncharacterized protein LOC100679373 isoform X1 [Nasonia vitripennis]
MIIGQQQISCSSAITLTQGEDDAVAGGHRSDNDLGMETKVAAWLLIDYLKGARALILRQILHRLIRRSRNRIFGQYGLCSSSSEGVVRNIRVPGITETRRLILVPKAMATLQ